MSNTGAVQYFYILKESSPGAGNRRIEAVAGQAARRTIDELVKATTGGIVEHNDVLAKAELDTDTRKRLFVTQKLTEQEDRASQRGGGRNCRTAHHARRGPRAPGSGKIGTGKTAEEIRAVHGPGSRSG